MRKYAPILVGIGFLGAAASPALANAGTPLMLAGMFQLYVGNTLIAVVESWIIHRFFKPSRRPWRTFWIMMLANFSSMVVGLIAMGLVGSLVMGALDAEALYILRPMLAVLFVASYVATLFLEWPFCAWAVGKRPKRLKASVKAVLLTQTVSYLLTVPLLLWASQLSLATKTHIDRQFVASAPNIATVYFLSEDERSLWRIRLNGSGLTRVMDVPAPDRPETKTAIYLSRQKGQEWNLVLDRGKAFGEQMMTVLIPGVADLGGLPWGIVEGNEEIQGTSPYSTWPLYAAGLEPAELRDWWIETWPIDHVYAVEGLKADNRRTGEKVFVALETPFVHWRMGNAALLLDDLVVFQLESQIVLLDLHTRRMGRIAMGRNPVVVLDEEVAAKALAKQTATTPASARRGE